jgi:hypothetical protein
MRPRDTDLQLLGAAVLRSCRTCHTPTVKPTPHPERYAAWTCSRCRSHHGYILPPSSRPVRRPSRPSAELAAMLVTARTGYLARVDTLPVAQRVRARQLITSPWRAATSSRLTLSEIGWLILALDHLATAPAPRPRPRRGTSGVPSLPGWS